MNALKAMFKKDEMYEKTHIKLVKSFKIKKTFYFKIIL